MEVHVSVAKRPLGAALFLIAATIPAAPASAQARAASAPDVRIEGHWVRKDVGGAGSFGGLADQIPPAQLTAEAAAGLVAPLVRRRQVVPILSVCPISSSTGRARIPGEATERC
jgi:hypothetical protein